MQELLFIALNITDAYLTKVGIGMGSREAFFWSASFSSNMLAKGLIAAGIVIGLYFFGREKSLWWMNIIVLGAVIWNLMQCGILHFCGVPWPI